MIGRILLVGAIAASLLAAGEADAHADTFTHDAALFCRLLDQDHSPRGVVAAIQAGIDDGVDKETLKAIIQYGLMSLCPEYIGAYNTASDIYVGKKRLL